MDQRANGLGGDRSATTENKEDTLAPDDEAERLEQKVDAIRDHLGDLVGELDRRRHRLGKPLLIGAAVVAGLAVTGLVVWLRLRRPPPSLVRNMRLALQRMAAHPDRVAKSQPNAAKKIAVAAGAAAASVVARKWAQRWVVAPPRAS